MGFTSEKEQNKRGVANSPSRLHDFALKNLSNLLRYIDVA